MTNHNYFTNSVRQCDGKERSPFAWPCACWGWAFPRALRWSHHHHHSTFPARARAPARAPVPIDINGTGVITGWYVDAGDVNHGFLRAPDGMINRTL